MRKRNQKICDLCIGQKILCAKFGTYSKELIAGGDDKNCIQIWRIGNQKSIGTFSTSTNQNSQSEVTSVQFSFSENELYSGSNRGIINIWDIESQKQLSTLKGHTTCVNSLCIYPNDENKFLLFSGAYDTLIKLWDLRSKSTVQQFKGHQMQINTLVVSPNSKILASGSNDGLVKVWDIGQGRIITSFPQHDNQITCLAFNPEEKALASGGADRVVRYWDLDRLTQISATRTDTTPIQNIIFDNKGKILFSAANESLKVWDIEKDCQLLDNVESSWRGVQDTIIINDQLLGLAVTQQGLSLHGVQLKSISMDPKSIEVRSSGGVSTNNKRGKTPDKRNEIQTAQPKQQNSETKVKSKPSLQMQAQNILNQDINYERQLSNDQFKEIPQQQQQQQQFLPPIQTPLQHNQFQQQPLKNYQNENFQQQLLQQQQQQLQQQQLYQYTIGSSSSNNQQQQQQQQQNSFQQCQYPLTQQQQQLDQFQYYSNQTHTPQNLNNKQITQFQQIMPLINKDSIEEEGFQPDKSEFLCSEDLSLSSFMIGDANKEKFKQVDLINEISKDHNKVNEILAKRLDYMKPIMHWWSNGNLKSAANGVKSLEEPSYILDALMLCCQQPKFSQFPIESLPSLMEKARILLEQRYSPHVKGGLIFLQCTLNQFRDEILSIKLFTQLSKADLAREERIQKYDKIIDQFKIIVQSPKLQRIIDRNKEEISDMAKRFQIDVVNLLKKVNQNQMQG